MVFALRCRFESFLSLFSARGQQRRRRCPFAPQRVDEVLERVHHESVRLISILRRASLCCSIVVVVIINFSPIITGIIVIIFSSRVVPDSHGKPPVRYDGDRMHHREYRLSSLLLLLLMLFLIPLLLFSQSSQDVGRFAFGRQGPHSR